MDPQAILEFLKGLVVLVWTFAGVRVIVGHTLINVVVALAAAQATGEINLSKLGEFLIKKLLPNVAVYVMVKAFGEAAGLAFLAPVVWAAIEASLIGDLLDNWTRLGLPLPEALARVVVKDQL